jgi:RNA polymerase sigma-70 factor (ECF subfamily)
MIAVQGSETRAYVELFRELDAWLRGYYGRRRPGPAGDDATQDTLLAIHAKRHAYEPCKPFGPRIAGIARHKWIDRLRAATQVATLSVHYETAVGRHVEPAVGPIAVEPSLRQLKPAQVCVIRPLKLQGLSIQTGRSAALVKVNIHRGLRNSRPWLRVSLRAQMNLRPETPAQNRSHSTNTVDCRCAMIVRA